MSGRVITPRPRATAAMSERAALLGRDGDRPSSSRATRDRARARDDAYDVERARGEIDADDGARDAGDDARGGKTTRASDGAGRDARRRGRAACVALGAMVAVLGARARGTATGDARARESAALGLTPVEREAFTRVPDNAGVALNGWLHLEDWFFANGESTLVDSPLGRAQGRVLPPFFNSAEELGFSWSSEGELVAKLAKKYGNLKTVKIMNAYRSSWMTNADVEKIARVGYKTLRLPVNWAAFMGTEKSPTRVVEDPKYSDRAQVTVDQMTLTNVLRILHKKTGARVVVDMHNMPGGSSEGTYNGVSPHPPAFWDDAKLQDVGVNAIHSMFKWYNHLTEDDKDFVDGFTLLNEPAHLMPAKRDAMLAWMEKAIFAYRQLVARPREMSGKRVPKLYVNLMETSGLAVQEYGKLMRKWFDREELRTWAVLDTHFYLAWGVNGCKSGCAWSCSDSSQHITETVRSAMAGHIAKVKRTAEDIGVHQFSVGEWSLATHHDSAMGCDEDRVKHAVYRGQMRAFEVANMPNFFWGWKMQRAGKHQDFWSMEHFQASLGAFHDDSEVSGGNVTTNAGRTTPAEQAQALPRPTAARLGASQEDASEEYSDPMTLADAMKAATSTDVLPTPVAPASSSPVPTTSPNAAEQQSLTGIEAATSTDVLPTPVAPASSSPVPTTSPNAAEQQSLTGIETNATEVNSSSTLGFEGHAAPWEKASRGLPPVDFTQENQNGGPNREQKHHKSDISDEFEEVEPRHSSHKEQPQADREQKHHTVRQQPIAAQPTTYQQPQQTATYQQPAQPTTYQQPQQTATYQQPAQPTTYQQPQQTATYQQPAQPVPMSGSSQSRPALAPARQVVPSRFAPAVQAPVTSSTTSDKPIVYAKDRHDGSFWGTSYGLDALKPPEIHQNSLMIDDEQNVDETEYYEEPREAVAARTGAKLPTYADDAADHLYHHRSTYSMHDAKHMKHKISYDLFSSSASKASDSYDDDDDDVDEDTRDAHGHGRKKHDESVDFEALAESQSFVPKESSKHNKNPWDDSVERAPKKKSSHRSSSADFDEDDDEGDENLSTHAQHGSSKHSHKSKKHASKSDAYSADALEESFAEDDVDHDHEHEDDDEGIPAWIQWDAATAA
jgi:hypothetical protein